jgi:hypothetical protein
VADLGALWTNANDQDAWNLVPGYYAARVFRGGIVISSVLSS